VGGRIGGRNSKNNPRKEPQKSIDNKQKQHEKTGEKMGEELKKRTLGKPCKYTTMCEKKQVGFDLSFLRKKVVGCAIKNRFDYTGQIGKGTSAKIVLISTGCKKSFCLGIMKEEL
jgi:hypothetical protein